MNEVESDRDLQSQLCTCRSTTHNPLPHTDHTLKHAHIHRRENEGERHLEGRKAGLVRAVHSSGNVESGCGHSRLRLHCLWEGEVAALPSLCLPPWRLEFSSSGRFSATPILTPPTLPGSRKVPRTSTLTPEHSKPLPTPGLTNGTYFPSPSHGLCFCPGLLSPHTSPATIAPG